MSELKGKRILLTRPIDQSEAWAEELRREGAIPVIFPLIETAIIHDVEAFDKAVKKLPFYDKIVLTSSNGARYFIELLKRLPEIGNSDYTKYLPAVVAIGPVTAKEARNHGLTVEEISAKFNSEELVKSIDLAPGSKVLHPTSDIGRGEVYNGLSQKGIQTDELIVYQTKRAAFEQKDLIREMSHADVVTFASPSAIRAASGVFSVFKELPVIACIGSTTAAEALIYRIQPKIVANSHSIKGIIDALNDYYSNETKTKKIKNER